MVSSGTISNEKQDSRDNMKHLGLQYESFSGKQDSQNNKDPKRVKRHGINPTQGVAHFKKTQ